MQPSLVIEPASPRKGQSIFGVISFGIGLVSLTMVCGGMGLIVFLTIERHGGSTRPATDALLTALCVMASIPLSIIGAGSGVITFFEKDKHRIFGILGIILNVLAFLIVGGLFVLGMIAQARGVPPNL